ncbi:MAG: gamma-glutamyl-gamma-aminobutyrate hydrolase family protein [Thermosediminibacteraceae bacterium]|nr:gamma-glutamyl-gamma-aminobutyrate hydrolase family protein [Thermosediminibacteraceae bacterium]
MKPLIAITCSFADERIFLNHGYYEAVEKAGGIPVIVPPLGDEEALLKLLDRVDGLLLSGGPDVDPRYFNEDPMPGLGEISPLRDKAELFLCREAVKRKKPVLGICRGAQVINIALGGSVYQDIGSAIERPLKHRQEAPRWYGSHDVRVIKDSVLYRIFEANSFPVNSFHHQAIKDVGSSLKSVAFAPDGVVEAVEGISEEVFLVGVQWHPEEMWERYPEQLKLFKAFVDAAARI